MTRTVHCQKLQQELPGLDYTPLPGELGQKLYDNISTKAWDLWLEQQTMLINEYRLNMMEPQSREFLLKEMQRFLFEGSNDKPEGYVAPETSN